MQANSFQVVMATDGKKSYIIYIYNDIKWGQGGMGFNAGDGVKSFTLPGSLTPAARDVEYGSNVGVTGLYAYRVDLPDIESPGGESSTDHKLLPERELIKSLIFIPLLGTEFTHTL